MPKEIERKQKGPMPHADAWHTPDTDLPKQPDDTEQRTLWLSTFCPDNWIKSFN